ncbi:30S ribosomal protein S6 [Candidatus Gottesmanbacteria bacterium]|nr:30S ribosomal protein S6 [Candidatus Gottesmanbacteria bacterium]
MTRKYELMVIMIPTYDASKESDVKKMLETLVGDTLRVKDVTVHGKKELAYEINKHKEGIYIFCTLEGMAKIADIENRVKLGTDVIRYLLTVTE